VDEIELFTSLRPRVGIDLADQRERARARLAGAMSESGARASTGHHGRRLGGLNSPTRTAFTVGGAALAVGGATVLAAVLPTVLSSGQSGSLITSAWAVQPRKDGTVKVTIKDASDPAGLQRALRAAGIRAVVVSPREVSRKDAQGGWVTHPICSYPTAGPLFAPAAVQRAVVTVPRPATGSARSPRVIAFIHPAAMPKGSVLFISDTFSALPNGSRSLSVTSPAVLKGDKLPRCLSNEPPRGGGRSKPPPPPPGSHHHPRHPAGCQPDPGPNRNRAADDQPDPGPNSDPIRAATYQPNSDSIRAADYQPDSDSKRHTETEAVLIRHQPIAGSERQLVPITAAGERVSYFRPKLSSTTAQLPSPSPT
jgi:hypothetical protein